MDRDIHEPEVIYEASDEEEEGVAVPPVHLLATDSERSVSPLRVCVISCVVNFLMASLL